jgi:hypothetical protein
MKTYPLEIQRLTEGKWRQENGDGKKGIHILHIARLGDKLNRHPRRFFCSKLSANIGHLARKGTRCA